MFERLKVAWRCLFRKPLYEAEVEGDDGWSDWIHPLPGYRLECCDCGLVHEMSFAIVPAAPGTTPEQLNEGETIDQVVIFAARRA